jgi:hypothetical protein
VGLIVIIIGVGLGISSSVPYYTINSIEIDHSFSNLQITSPSGTSAPNYFHANVVGKKHNGGTIDTNVS